MFTGIVQDVGQLRRRERREGDERLTVGVRRLSLAALRVGDSVCVSGVCLTVTALEPDAFAADVSRETLGLTTLGALAPGSAVNLEPALRAGDALGGHLVSGHVDGLATIADISRDARSMRVSVAVPPALARYLSPKGSVTLDGVSLTVNEVEGATFGVNLIPHTQEVTTLGRWQAGDHVNLEIDAIARYVERLLADRLPAAAPGAPGAPVTGAK
jgi:riboflavin synthase